MPPELFWKGDPQLAKAYWRANQLKIQKASEEMWLQGLYVYNALNASLSNVFKKKGREATPYMEEPIRLIPYTQEEKEQKAKQEREKTIAYFTNLAKKWGKTDSAKC